STITIKSINRTVVPEFSYRSLGSHLRDYSNKAQHKNMRPWKHHLKLGGSINPPYKHSFWRTINGNNSNNVHSSAVKKLYKEHPQWFAMNTNGKRPAPKRKFNKLE